MDQKHHTIIESNGINPTKISLKGGEKDGESTSTRNGRG